jgi:2,4-dienoyl-CoA reductase-like NADH-dependent reductase (Old Yellow Enzyme family)
MPELFEKTSIRSMHLPNRFVRSATWEGLADKDGAVTQKLTEMMTVLAGGEVGLIISSYAFVSPEGQSSPGQLSVYDDRFLPGLRDMAQAVQAAGGKIALQLVHGGCYGNAKLTGLGLIGPSTVEKDGQVTCRQAGSKDINAIISAFARAAGRAQQAGFDAVQIHTAHGFLLSQFLSPAFNRRNDEYGGSLENRARLVLEVVKSVRATVGPEYPILIKLNSEDFLEGGMTRAEAIRVAVLLEKASVDAIELSGGTVASPEKFLPPRPGRLKTPEQEAYYLEAARLYKHKVIIPLMLVGGVRSYDIAAKLVRNGTADYIALSRPLICEPTIVKRWREGDHRTSECISDNACFGPASDGRGLYCITMANKRNKARQ